MPQMMYSFFDEYDFSGKTIIPFNSHGGSGFSGSVQEIAEMLTANNIPTVKGNKVWSCSTVRSILRNER